MVDRVHSIQTSPLMACIILVLDFLTDLQLGFKRKSSEGVGDSSIDMSAGNVSRRLKVLKIILHVVTMAMGECGGAESDM